MPRRIIWRREEKEGDDVQPQPAGMPLEALQDLLAANNLTLKGLVEGASETASSLWQRAEELSETANRQEAEANEAYQKAMAPVGRMREEARASSKKASQINAAMETLADVQARHQEISETEQ